MDRSWIKDVQVGQKAAGIFAVARKQQASGKNGRVFLKLILHDKTGQLDARVWNQAEELGALFEVGDRLRVEGQVGTFQGLPQLTIDALEKSQDELPAEDFEFEAPEAPVAQAAPADGPFMALRSELGKVADPHVRALLFSFVDDPALVSKLRRAPAAKEIHHAYAGGLLDHILSCVRLAGRLADHYPMADRDLLIAGAFLHDLGKIDELSYGKGGTSYTDEGKLVGHLVMTATWIRERARVLSGFPKDLENHLIHIVLAHHGRLEYGSPKLPMTIEAFLVHELDEIDSRMNAMLGQMARSPGSRWTDPQKGYERMLWKGSAPTEGGKRRGPPAKGFGKGRAERKEKRQAAAEPGATGTAPESPAPRRERPPQERPSRERQPAPATQVGVEAPQAHEAGARKGPKILKRAEGAAKPPAAEKLTFKPFSAFTQPEGEAAEAEAHEPVTATLQARTESESELVAPVEATPSPENTAIDTPPPAEAAPAPAEAKPVNAEATPTPAADAPGEEPKAAAAEVPPISPTETKPDGED